MLPNIWLVVRMLLTCSNQPKPIIMNNYTFYSTFSIEENCINLFRSYYCKKVKSCNKCKSIRVKWVSKFKGWRCCECSHKISLKSICFLRDSNKSFCEWLEIIFLLLNDKKSLSINSIYRRSRQKRYETVYHMVRKIQIELGKLNKTEANNFYVKFLISEEAFRMNYSTSQGRKNDKIRLTLTKSAENQIQETKQIMDKRKTYPYPKILQKAVEIKGIFKNQKQQKIGLNWRRKIKSNLFKLLNGMHHNISSFHIQACLDEYCFKYNQRNNSEDNFLLFIKQISSYRKNSV